MRTEPVIDSEGLVLRPWTATDAPDLIEAYTDPLLNRFAPLALTDADEADRWLQLQSDLWAEGTRFSYAVLEEGALVGNVLLKYPQPEGPSAEIGYWTTAAARGRSVAPRAVRALSATAFAEVPALARIELLHRVDNPASCRVAEKSGYPFAEDLPPLPPTYPLPGHMHLRVRDGVDSHV